MRDEGGYMRLEGGCMRSKRAGGRTGSARRTRRTRRTSDGSGRVRGSGRWCSATERARTGAGRGRIARRGRTHYHRACFQATRQDPRRRGGRTGGRLRGSGSERGSASDLESCGAGGDVDRLRVCVFGDSALSNEWFLPSTPSVGAS